MLQGDRVTLRALERADLPHLHAMSNNLEVELAGGGDPPMPQSLTRVEADFDREAAQGGRDRGFFVIEADGQFIGLVVLHSFDDVAHTALLGIAIGDKAYWGRGYGREAVGLILRYAFRYHHLERVWLRVHARNQRAIRAYQACGFVEEGRLRRHVWSDGAYDDLVMMGILRDEWAG
jgi:RimJ/RimL family protein N-acetyltransferase